MRIADIQVLYDYNYWANDRILSTAASLTAEQFAAPTRFPWGSLRGTLRHIYLAERMWLDRLQETPLRPFLSEEELPDHATFQERWPRDEAELRAYLASLRDEDLDRLVTLTPRDGGPAWSAPQWSLLVHLVNHGTQHRGEAAQMLTEYGHSPGDIDLVLYLRRRAS